MLIADSYYMYMYLEIAINKSIFVANSKNGLDTNTYMYSEVHEKRTPPTHYLYRSWQNILPLSVLPFPNFDDLVQLSKELLFT